MLFYVTLIRTCIKCIPCFARHVTSSKGTCPHPTPETLQLCQHVWYSCLYNGWSVHRRRSDRLRPHTLCSVPSRWCWCWSSIPLERRGYQEGPLERHRRRSRRLCASTPFLTPSSDQRPSSSYISCNERCCGRVLRQDIICTAKPPVVNWATVCIQGSQRCIAM